MKKPIEMIGTVWTERQESKPGVTKKPIEMTGTVWKERQETKPGVAKKPVELSRNPWAANQLPVSAFSSRKPIEAKGSSWAVIPENEFNKKINKVDDVQIKAPSASWQAIQGLQAPEVIRQFEGVNEMDSFSIKDSHATRTKNLTTDKYPAMTVRKGTTSIRTAGDNGSGGLVTLTDRLWGLGKYAGPTFSGVDEIHVIVGSRWILIYNDGSIIQLKTGMNTQARYSFVQFQGSWSKSHLIAANGYGTPWKYNGAGVVSTLAGAPSGLNYVCTHDNRVYGAVGQTVYYSALRKAEDWSTVNDSGSIVVETVNSKDITGLVAGSARLTVFKKNSIHELFGTNPSNYQMKMVTDNLGCPAGQTAQVIDGVIYFQGNDAVYRYSGGAAPSSDFSIQVKETFAKINKSYAHASTSWVSNRRYYLAICTGTATTPNTILEYDLDFNTWNTWELPYSVVVKGVELNDYVYLGTNEGSLIKLDGRIGQDFLEPPNAQPSILQSIPWEWVSKPFTFSSLAVKSRWYRLWIVADIPIGATLKVHLSTEKEGEQWTLVQSVAPTTKSLQAKEILIPINVAFSSNWVRVRLEGTGPVTVHEISRQERSFPLGQ